jgi:hypothetical protein
MTDKKIIGTLENLITFNVSKDSLTRALKDIRRIKKAMQEAVNPVNMARKTTQKAGLFNDKMNILARNMATSKEKRARREQRVNSETEKLNRAHTQAIIEDRKRAAAITNKITNDEFKAQKKLDNQRNAQQSKAVKFDRRAQATQEWFGATFGRGGQRKATGLYNDLRAGKINAEQYSMRLRTLRGDLYRSQRAQRGFNQSIHDMRGAFIQATASYTAFAGVMGISNIGKQYEAQKAQMLVATGSREQAASQLEYLRSETYRLGLGREQASQGYTQIAMAGQEDIGVEGVNKLFTGLSELATATKLEPFKYEKVVNAMGQMLSKKQIYAEEYQQQ